MKGIIISFLLSLSILGLAGCNKDIEAKDTVPKVIEDITQEEEPVVEEPEQMLIWSYTDDILTEIQSFEEAYNADVTVEIIEMQGIAPMLKGIIKSGQGIPDLLIVDEETLHLETMSDFWADLSDFAMDFKASERLIPYVLEGGMNEENHVIGLGYQGTPMAIFYRRSAAKEALGFDDPKTMVEQFSSTDKLLETAEDLQGVGYKLFSDIYSLRYFIPNHDQWSLNDEGELVIDEQARSFLEMIKTFQLEEYVGYIPEWSNYWLESMHGPVATEDEDVKVFAYVLPSWALRHVLMLVGDSEEPLVKNEETGVTIYNETMGDWALTELIHPTYMGSTYMGVYKESEHLEMAKNFLDYMIFNQEHVRAWMEGSDMISALSEVQVNQEFPEGNAFLGGQDYHRMFGNIAQVLQFNPDRVIQKGQGVLPYETQAKINKYYEEVVMNFIQGDYHTIDEALKDLRENSMNNLSENEAHDGGDTISSPENSEDSETDTEDDTEGTIQE